MSKWWCPLKFHLQINYITCRNLEGKSGINLQIAHSLIWIFFHESYRFPWVINWSDIYIIQHILLILKNKTNKCKIITLYSFIKLWFFIVVTFFYLNFHMYLHLNVEIVSFLPLLVLKVLCLFIRSIFLISRYKFVF